MPLDPLDYRKVIGHFATGVTVVTAAHNGEPYGMTANSVTSVSLTPTLLLVCFMDGSETGIAVRESGWFCVNILDATQVDLSNKFAKQASDFDGVAWHQGDMGVPVLEGGLGHIICRVDRVVDGGDHDIVIGEVVTCDGTDGDPLLFYEGKYRQIAPQIAPSEC